jgi:type IV secretory pathway VirB3-like protein
MWTKLTCKKIKFFLRLKFYKVPCIKNVKWVCVFIKCLIITVQEILYIIIQVNVFTRTKSIIEKKCNFDTKQKEKLSRIHSFSSNFWYRFSCYFRLQFKDIHKVFHVFNDIKREAQNIKTFLQWVCYLSLNISIIINIFIYQVTE